MIYGLILAGGQSSRFGREKATAELNGRPLIARVGEVLLAGVDALAVSAKLRSAAAAYADVCGWPVLEDAPEDPEGPLAGVLAGLRFAQTAGAKWLCTAPCDTPLLPADLLVRLTTRASANGAVARTPNGLQPLIALWPVGALETVRNWPGRAAPRDILAGLGAAPVDFPDARAFANVNTPEDYVAALTAASRLR